MLMAKHFKTMAILPITGLAFFAQAELTPSVSPTDYGAFRFRESKVQPMRLQPEGECRGKGPQKVLAFAGDGNAEVDKLGELTLVEQEDFSKLTAGSEDNPDLSVNLEIPMWMTDSETGDILFDEQGQPIPNPEYEYPWNNMKPEYISGDKGWGVGNAYPAGGMLYFPFSQDAPQGKISTPWIDLSANGGTFVLEFKVRLTEANEPGDPTPSFIIVETAETNGMAPTWDFYEDSFVNYENLSTEWTTFRLLYQGAGPSTLCNIVGQGVRGGMLIDDIRIYTMRPFLSTPVARRHTDFTETSFVANWFPVDGAEKYVLNVWYDDLYGERHFVVKDTETTETSYKVEDTDLDETYFFTVKAVNSEHESLTTKPREVFDIIAPVMVKAEQTDDEGREFIGGVEEVISAYGYNYAAVVKRVAEEDGPFTVTEETFTGWSHPAYPDDWNFTKENPVDDMIVGYFFPTDIGQQGWLGQNFMIYKDYLCLCPFFYETTWGQEQTAWISPEFDLSKDGGRISVSLKLAAQYDMDHEVYASCVVGLYNWNDEKGDYEQVELAYCRDLNFDWQNRTVELKGGMSRSKIGIFAVGSFGDLYIDDIVIRQNYRAGESFYDPFFFRTWQLAETADDPFSFEFTVPDRAEGCEVYQKAQAVRMHFDARGAYDGEAASPYTENDFVTSVPTGVRLVEDINGCNVSVADGVIIIENPGRESVAVTSVDGKSLQLGNGSSINYRPGSKGLYIVTVGARGMKLSI